MPAVPIQPYPGCRVRLRLRDGDHQTFMLPGVSDIETAKLYVACHFPKAEFVEIATHSEAVSYRVVENVTPFGAEADYPKTAETSRVWTTTCFNPYVLPGTYQMAVVESPPGATAEAERIERLPKKQYTLQPKRRHRWIFIPAYTCSTLAGFEFASHRTWQGIALFGACEAFLILRVLILRPWRR